MTNNQRLQLAETLFDYHRLQIDYESCDVIIGLGSYDTRVADRCAELYLLKRAPRILFTGALGNWTREIWDEPEAVIFKRRAMECGVPEADILTECRATNLGENIALSRELLVQAGIEVGSVVLVTKPNTLRRAFATARKAWPQMKCYTDCPQLSLTDLPTPQRSLEAIIDEMAGDIERILKYPELGYQIEQETPQPVLDAWQELLKFGHDSHSMNNG